MDDTAKLLEAYDRLCGIQQVTTTDAVVCVQLGNHRIVFSTPDDFRTMHPALDLDPDFPLPGIVALELSVARREQTADYLTRCADRLRRNGRRQSRRPGARGHRRHSFPLLTAQGCRDPVLKLRPAPPSTGLDRFPIGAHHRGEIASSLRSSQ